VKSVSKGIPKRKQHFSVSDKFPLYTYLNYRERDIIQHIPRVFDANSMLHMHSTLLLRIEAKLFSLFSSIYSSFLPLFLSYILAYFPYFEKIERCL
jgi:hypothetical protein